MKPVVTAAETWSACGTCSRCEERSYDRLHREPWMSVVVVDGAVGSPCGEVGDDAACVQSSVPVEGVVVDRVWSDLAVGVDESVGESAGRGVDDRSERFRSGEGWVGEEQVGEGEVERGVRTLNGCRSP